MAIPAATLFCFPPAGGGSAGFRPWVGALAPDIEVRTIILPGRERRFAEPLLRDFGELMALLRTEFVPPAGPFVFFGHSLGALVSYELTRDLERRGCPLPRALVVSGRRPPTALGTRPQQHLLSDDALVDELGVLGGTPPEILDNRTFIEPFLPVLRADLALNETFPVQDVARAVPCPMFAYAGLEDPLATPVAVAGWRAHTTGRCVTRVFPGGHFFINDARRDVLAALRRDVLDAVSLPAAQSWAEHVAPRP